MQPKFELIFSCTKFRQQFWSALLAFALLWIEARFGRVETVFTLRALMEGKLAGGNIFACVAFLFPHNGRCMHDCSSDTTRGRHILITFCIRCQCITFNLSNSRRYRQGLRGEDQTNLSTRRGRHNSTFIITCSKLAESSRYKQGFQGEGQTNFSTRRGRHSNTFCITCNKLPKSCRYRQGFKGEVQTNFSTRRGR